MKKLNKLKYHVLALGMLVSTAMQLPEAVAQKIDQERMQRDLEVSETVLKSLIKTNKNRNFIYGSNTSSQYLEGYGVIISIPSNAVSFGYSFSTSTQPVPGYNFNGENVAIEVARAQAESAREQAEMARELAAAAREQAEIARGQAGMESREIEARTRAEVLRGTASVRGVTTFTSEQLDSLREKSDELMIDAMKTFLVDYADLISQLKDSDKIMLTESKGRSNMMWTSYGGDPVKPKAGLSAEMKKSDLNAYKAGKISREEAMKKITVTERGKEVPVEQDIEMLAGIFNRLYRADLSKTFFIEGNILFERIPDYGAIFNMRTASSYVIGAEQWRMPTKPNVELNKDERNKEVSALYPQFEKELKEHIIDYGRTVKSLKDDEQLIFKIQITKCEGCGIPSTIEASVKGSVLKEFNSGKLDRNAAIAKINIKKGENQ